MSSLWLFIRNSVIARAARVRALEARVAELEAQQASLDAALRNLAQNVADLINVGSDPAHQINAHLAILASQRGFNPP